MRNLDRFPKIWESGISASCVVGVALSSGACGAPADKATVDDAAPSVATQGLKGGTLTNAFGVVKFPVSIEQSKVMVSIIQSAFT